MTYFTHKLEIIMKTHRKLFLIYCFIMLVIIIGQQMIDVVFQNEAPEFTLNKLVATFVYLIVGAISLTLVPFPSSGFFLNLNVSTFAEINLLLCFCK